MAKMSKKCVVCGCICFQKYCGEHARAFDKELARGIRAYRKVLREDALRIVKAAWEEKKRR
jgi:antirestriction protein ArdC